MKQIKVIVSTNSGLYAGSVSEADISDRDTVLRVLLERYPLSVVKLKSVKTGSYGFIRRSNVHTDVQYAIAARQETLRNQLAQIQNEVDQLQAEMKLKADEYHNLSGQAAAYSLPNYPVKVQPKGSKRRKLQEKYAKSKLDRSLYRKVVLTSKGPVTA